MAEILEDRRMLYGLSTGAGDGGLEMTVDGYGSFGSAVFFDINNIGAVYNPIGPKPAASVSFESGVAFRIGSSGPRQFLTSGSIGFTEDGEPEGGLPAPPISGTSTNATSDFALSGLTFNLLQAVSPMINDSNVQTGSLLTQSYLITNSTSAPIQFEMVRYFDGDLLFDGTLLDGGGRLVKNGHEFLFETDAGGTGSTDTTFIGMDSTGGTIPTTDRFQLEHYFQLEEDLIAGAELNGTIEGDTNGDGFVENGNEYDITLALRNTFNLAPGESTVYTTRTIFGSGTPEDVDIRVPQVSLGADVAQVEGDSGLTNLVFSVSLNRPATSPATVFYSTADGTALAGSDYLAQSGTLSFLPGDPTTQFVTIQVIGDVTGEDDETFQLQLTGGLEVQLERSVATGTIFNDDIDFSINDVTAVEGDSGTTNAVFTITAQGTSHVVASVGYGTSDGTANGGNDYVPQFSAVTFQPGVHSRTVTIAIVGDTLFENTEQFFVNLSNPVNGHVLRSPGVGTIIDNEPTPLLYVNDVHVTSVDQDLLQAVFTVALDRRSSEITTVAYATADDVAKAGINYVAQSGTLTFGPGVTTQFVTVPIVSSSAYGANERFFLNIADPANAQLGDAQGIATIIFADAPGSEFIQDDGDDAYSQTPGWTNVTNLMAYQLDYDYARGNGSNTATWTFNSIPDGSYQIFARWVPFSNRATNAPYTVLDGQTSLGTVLVNQQLAPTGDQSNGITWQSLGTFSTTTNRLVVRLSDNANGYVVADAIRIVSGSIAPQVNEMDVSVAGHSIDRGANLASADNGTDFGHLAALSNSITRTFTISNTGNADLHLGGNPRVQVTGDAAQDFTVLTQPALLVPPGSSTTFKIMFHPTAAGVRQATVSIANDDGNESPYTFLVQGTGEAEGPSELIQDDPSALYQPIGSWTTVDNDLALGANMHASPGGQGANKATWTFNNLAPAQYDIYTTWIPFLNRATNAPYSLVDGNGSPTTVTVNQQLAPSGATSQGVNWQSLGTMFITSGTLGITLSNQANGFVVADAVRIVRHDAGAAPQVAHNTALPRDVNADQRISSIDALIVINALNLQAASAASNAAEPLALPAATAAFSNVRYVDVNGDGIISPRDVLMVINYLLDPPAAGSSAVSLTLAATDGSDNQSTSDGSTQAVALSSIAVDQAVDFWSDTASTLAAPGLVTVAPVAAASDPPQKLLTPVAVRACFASQTTKSAGDDDADLMGNLWDG